ncbi:hypothetical protein [Caulobacter sp. LjRoot300]|uniref:hypothetical protein n=1 Tax=Caulobacter sp. LjRoot300 TaxID=3342321 RepID=UPI003F4F9F0D
MPEPRSQQERYETAAAERRIHGLALGYQPMRMKPVHFATSFLLALTGKYSKLELLNKAAVPRISPKPRARVVDEYVAEALLPKLRDLGKLSADIDPASFRALRAHLNAAFNNDGAALIPAFAPHSPFSSDYSAPSVRYIANQSKNHGHSGAFVMRVLQASAEGQSVIEACRALVALPPPPLETLGRPLLDDHQLDWVDDYDQRFGVLDATRAADIASLMAPQTRALGRLLENLLQDRSVYALRYMIIGLCSWLFVYMMRRQDGSPLLLLDALDGANGRIRTQSRASYARQLDRFSRSYDLWRDAEGADVSDAQWAAFAQSSEARQTLEDHFRDLGVRVGFIQPRAPSAKRKHAEIQADTLRVLALSLLGKDEVMTVVDFARRLREVWCLSSGAAPEDVNLLHAQGFAPLDSDEDLEPNGAAFRDLLIRLGLAVEPSDGLTLCALRAEELI